MVFFLVFLALIAVFSPWFSFESTLSSGDWPYLFKENIVEFSFFSKESVLWLAPYYQSTAKVFVQHLGFSWELAERVFWFWPFIAICIASSYYLTRSWIGALIYTANSYILMVVGGGQMGIALAYSLVPFALGMFIKLIDRLVLHSENIKYQKSKIIGDLKLEILRKSGVVALLLALLTMFDPRISYIIVITIILYAGFNIQFTKTTNRYLLGVIVFVFFIPLAITFALNSYWIIPLLIGGIPMEHKGLESVAGFEFLSFADFSHTFSLLQSNWPENIFGKTYFMRPEFLLLPTVAYSSLLFLKNSKFNPPAGGQNSKLQLKSERLGNNLIIEQVNGRAILFFAFLGLFGAFLAKGVNEPFGFVNEWLFQSFPGMNMFRDSTKFYILVSLSYSVLIPFSLCSAQEWLISNIKNQISNTQIKNKIFYISYAFFIFSILYFIFLIRPAIFGQLGGTFKPQAVPAEYITLKNFILSQEDPFNTLWVPKVQRFGFHSKINQAMGADQLLGVYSVSAILKEFQKPKIKHAIRSLGIKYIVVPYDSQKEIFLTDRQYDFSLYNSTVATLQKIKWIERESSFGDIVAFRVLE